MNTLIILQYAIERLVCTSGSGSDDLCGDLLHWCDTVVLLLSCMFGRGSKVAEEASRTSMVLKHSREVGDKNKDVTTLEWNREGTLLATGIINNVPFRAKRVAVPLVGYPYQLCRCGGCGVKWCGGHTEVGRYLGSSRNGPWDLW